MFRVLVCWAVLLDEGDATYRLKTKQNPMGMQRHKYISLKTFMVKNPGVPRHKGVQWIKIGRMKSSQCLKSRRWGHPISFHPATPGLFGSGPLTIYEVPLTTQRNSCDRQTDCLVSSKIHTSVGELWGDLIAEASWAIILPHILDEWSLGRFWGKRNGYTSPFSVWLAERAHYLNTRPLRTNQNQYYS